MNTISTQQEYCDQRFEAAHLEEGQIIACDFTDCNFVECDFESVIFKDCKFSNCMFWECNLNFIRIAGSTFPSTRFEKSTLVGVDWTQGNWSQMEYNSPNGFYDCGISHCTFIGLKLSRMMIKNCIAHNVDFREADMSKVNFKGTDLSKSLFNNTNLEKADFDRAKNYQINPGANNLKAAKFSLPEAMALLYSMDIELVESDQSIW